MQVIYDRIILLKKKEREKKFLYNNEIEIQSNSVGALTDYYKLLGHLNIYRIIRVQKLIKILWFF
jgi:hypothetical protein